MSLPPMIDLLTALTIGPYFFEAAKLIAGSRTKPPEYLIFFNEADYEVCIPRDVTSTQTTDKDYFEVTFTVHRTKHKFESTKKSMIYKRNNTEDRIND